MTEPAKKKKKRWTYKDRRPWWKPKPPNREKRVRLEPDEIIVGPKPLSVVWDDGKRFIKAAEVVFGAWKRTKDKETKKYIKEVILEGDYGAYSPMRYRMKAAPQHEKDQRDRSRARWNKRRVAAFRKMRKTAYGFIPASKTLSTMPT